MKRTLPGYVIIIFSVLCLITNSCLEESCIEETEAYVKAGFYSYSTKAQVVPDSITLYGIGKTDNIYNKEKVTPPALIPLNDSTEYAAFVIKINGIADTIEFQYWSYPHLVTKECGYSMFHNVYNIYHTRHAIDSVSNRDENITTLNAENIGIYY